MGAFGVSNNPPTLWPKASQLGKGSLSCLNFSRRTRRRTRKAADRARDRSKSVTKNHSPHKLSKSLSRVMPGIIKQFKEVTPGFACTTEKVVLMIED